MTKVEFISKLRSRLKSLPKKEIEERLSFYSEIIDDFIEEGISEEDATTKLGDIEKIYQSIVFEITQAKIKSNEKGIDRSNITKTVLLILGSPIWLSLIISAFAIVISLYAVLWSLIVSAWSVFGALVGCAAGGIIGAIIIAATSNLATGAMLIASALICLGLAIFAFYGCRAATKGTAILSAKAFHAIIRLFKRRRNVI